MTVSTTATQALDAQSIAFQLVKLPGPLNCTQIREFLGDDARYLVRAVAFNQPQGAIYTLSRALFMLDVADLAAQTGGTLQVMSATQQRSVAKPEADGMLAAIPQMVQARALVDKSILTMPKALITSGMPGWLIELQPDAISALYADCEPLDFSVAPSRLYARNQSATETENGDIDFSVTRLKQRVDETFDLPAMPEIAQDIMKLRVDPSADAAKLGEIVSRDPSLAAQVVSWATSPYYGYQGKIDSVETAIARVLGFELVMNLALGISIGKSLKIPLDGPLGIHNFWRQAVFSANLSEKLCKLMPVSQRPEKGLVYLSGLLHNFGHLLMGHLFPPQFELINTAIEANPNTPVEDIERYMMGASHCELGAWLMQNWHMPEELIVAVHRHHQEEFWSKHAVYSNLVLVSNKLLKRIGIGDMVDPQIAQSTLELLSIDEQHLSMALAEIEEESDALNNMVKQLVA